MVDPANQLENLRERVDESDAISDDDRAAIQTFDDALGLETAVGEYRQLKLLRHITIMAEQHGDVAPALEDRDVAEDLVRWIHENYDNEETNQDYRVALKGIGRRVSDENGTEPPDSLAWISSETSRNYDPKPDPTNMLDWDDVQAMIEETHNSRDAAAIAVQFFGGFRPESELAEVTIGDVDDHDYGFQLTVDGKTGRRTVTLISSVPYLTRWLDDHPASDDGDAPLWSKLDAPEAMSYTMFTKMFKEPAERAGITKPATPQNLRRSSASYYASKGMNQAKLEDRMGWVRGSDRAARYITVFSGDQDREVARIHGLDVEEQDDEGLAPLECPRCGRETPQDRELCMWCGQALEPGAAEKAEKLEDLIVTSIAAADDDEDTERLLELRDRAKNDAQLRAEAIEELGELLES